MRPYWIFLLLPACFSESTDSAAPLAEEQNSVGAHTSEGAFVKAHVQALCAVEVEAVLTWPGTLDYSDPVDLTRIDCPSRLEDFYLDFALGRFLPEVAAACHDAYLEETAPAPFGDLDWRWCAFAWQP